MKKFTSLLTIALLAITAISFTSCEANRDDFDISENLDGYWYGSLGQYYETVYGKGYEEWETEFQFHNYSPRASSGEGVEIDYDPSNHNRYKKYYFKYTAAYGDIYLIYKNGEKLMLRQYSLSANRLRGRLETFDGGYIADIDLERQKDTDWDDDTQAKQAPQTRAADDEHTGFIRDFSKFNK